MIKLLGNLECILDKAIAHAAARKIDDAAFVEARLFPDMFTLARQVRVATDMAKGAGARLAGIEIPKFDDNEKTLPLPFFTPSDKTNAQLRPEFAGDWKYGSPV